MCVQVCQGAWQTDSTLWVVDCGQSIGGATWTNNGVALYLYTYGGWNIEYDSYVSYLAYYANPDATIDYYATYGYGWHITTGFAPPTAPFAEIGFRSVSGRMVGGTYLLFLVAEPDPGGTSATSRLWSFNTDTSQYSYLATSAQNTLYKSVVPGMYNPQANPTVAASARPTHSSTATPTSSLTHGASASASPAYPLPVNPASLLAVRIGDGYEDVTGYAAVSVWVDEVEPNSGTVLQSLALPTTPVGAHLGCTLTGSGYAHEALPSLSPAGDVFMVSTAERITQHRYPAIDVDLC